MYNIVSNVRSKSQLVEQTMNYVNSIIPPELYCKSKDEALDDNAPFNKYSQDFGDNSLSQTIEENVSEHFYVTALTCHNKIISENLQLSTIERENLFINLFRISYGEDSEIWLNKLDEVEKLDKKWCRIL